jgi:hypothetical protein
VQYTRQEIEMPKGRGIERSLNGKSVRRATGFVAALVVAAGVVVNAFGGRGDSVCPLVAARFDSAVAPVLVVHACMIVPHVGPAFGFRYDVEVRITIVPAIDDVARLALTHH